MKYGLIRKDASAQDVHVKFNIPREPCHTHLCQLTAAAAMRRLVLTIVQSTYATTLSRIAFSFTAERRQLQINSH